MKMQSGILVLCMVFEVTALQASQQSEGTKGIGATIAVTRRVLRTHDTAGTAASARKVLGNYSRLPRSFEANFGQCDPEVRFFSRGTSDTLFLTSKEVVLTFADAGAPASLGKTRRLPTATGAKARTGLLRMEFVGANALPQLNGMEELPGKKHYLRDSSIEESIANVPTYAKVIYHHLYTGVDLVFYGHDGQFEFDAIVAPGSDPRIIKLRFAGASRPVLNTQGDLVMETSGGPVQFHSPFVYQEVEGTRKQIAALYRLKHNEVSFSLGPYDSSRALVIDPTLSCSTYLGGRTASGRDWANAITVDAAGNMYLAGVTGSADFPTINAMYPRCAMSSQGACNEGFIAKLDASGSRLVYSTYLTGSWAGGSNFANGIAADAAGNAYVTGSIAATTAFVMKLDPAGALLWTQRFTGSPGSSRQAVAVDGNGYVYVTGSTSARGFSPIVNALQPESGKDSCTFGSQAFPEDAFVAKLSPSGGVVYSTFLGGDGSDAGTAIALDPANNACVAGQTTSTDFPTVNPYQRANAGFSDAFVARVADPYFAKSHFAHFANGQGISSNLVLVNPSADKTATGTAELFDSAGRPLSVDINGTIQQGSFPFSIPPTGVGFYATGGAGERAVGSVQVSSSSSIGGTILFSGDLGVAGVGSAQMTAKSLVPIESDVSRSVYTGVAIANPYSTDLSLTLSLLDLQGDTIGASTSIQLPANGQVARFPEEIFSGSGIDFSRFRGALKVESPLSVSAMAIQARPGQIATLPVTPIEGGSQKLYFAHFANGQGMASMLILVNPSLTRTAHGTARFFSSDGSPLALGLNGGARSASLDFTLQPLGTAFHSTDGSGDLTVGSVEVSADVALGGSIIFVGSDGLTGVGAAQPAATFLVPIESDSAKQIYTGVAISNPADSAVDVSLLLHDSEGAPVNGGSVQLTLPAKGHTAKFVEELYEGKGINLAAFRGVLEVNSPIPINGMALRATPHEYATLPVTTVK